MTVPSLSLSLSNILSSDVVWKFYTIIFCCSRLPFPFNHLFSCHSMSIFATRHFPFPSLKHFLPSSHSTFSLFYCFSLSLSLFSQQEALELLTQRKCLPNYRFFKRFLPWSILFTSTWKLRFIWKYTQFLGRKLWLCKVIEREMVKEGEEKNDWGKKKTRMKVFR